MRAAVASFVAGASVLTVGCGGGDESPPPPSKSVVADAARTTFQDDQVELRLRVEGRGYAVVAAGIEELAEGRFLVEARLSGRPPGGRADPRRLTVIGTNGEGFETTYEVGVPSGPRDCWLNPHDPVGFPGEPLSVEEAVRVVGAVLESLRSEIATAQTTDGAYEVELKDTATRPRSDFDGSKRRVWGDRNLLTLADSPIRVSVRGGLTRRIALKLTDYKPPRYLQSSGGRRRSPRDVSVVARLSPTSERLELERPRCVAME